MNSVEEELELYGKGFGNYRHLPYLERGKWHNFTMYVKLGYNENQQPRTVLYIDSKKVADWHTPNAYNCQEFGEYLVSVDNSGLYDLEDYRMLNYQGIIAPLVAAVQKLDEKINDILRKDENVKSKSNDG